MEHHQFEHLERHLAQINHKLEHIMSAISDFAAKQNAFNDQMDTAVSGLTDDVKSLNDQIAELQASAGTVTPEDQALLDGITTRAQGIADKLAALDALGGDGTGRVEAHPASAALPVFDPGVRVALAG